MPACDLKLEGADAVLKGLSGGLDGLYVVSSCESGLPLYKRKDSKAHGAQCARKWGCSAWLLNSLCDCCAENRVLWYSGEYRDWDISNGSTPTVRLWLCLACALCCRRQSPSEPLFGIPPGSAFAPSSAAVQEDILVYGGDGGREVRPQLCGC